MYGNAREGGCAQARPPLLRSYSVERILNRCSVVRPIVDTSATLVNVGNGLRAGCSICDRCCILNRIRTQPLGLAVNAAVALTSEPWFGVGLMFLLAKPQRTWFPCC
jgi:hypothetical protein